MLPARPSTLFRSGLRINIFSQISVFTGSTSHCLHHPSSPHLSPANTSRQFAMTQSTNSSTTLNGPTTTSYKKVLTIDTINPAVREAKYAVRGEIALRANELEAQLKKGNRSLPFKDVVHSEIGNPQALDQKPLSFIRQVWNNLS